MTMTLADGLISEIARVRDEVLPAYYDVLKFAPMTAITIALMRQSLDRAALALANGEATEVLAAYQDLKEWEA